METFQQSREGGIFGKMCDKVERMFLKSSQYGVEKWGVKKRSNRGHMFLAQHPTEE